MMPPQLSEKGSSCCKTCCSRTVLHETLHLPQECIPVECMQTYPPQHTNTPEGTWYQGYPPLEGTWDQRYLSQKGHGTMDTPSLVDIHL